MDVCYALGSRLDPGAKYSRFHQECRRNSSTSRWWLKEQKEKIKEGKARGVQSWTILWWETCISYSESERSNRIWPRCRITWVGSQYIWLESHMWYTDYHQQEAFPKAVTRWYHLEARANLQASQLATWTKKQSSLEDRLLWQNRENYWRIDGW